MNNKVTTLIDGLLKAEMNPNETLKQIVTFGGAGGFLSWGASEKINYKNKALVLKVNGHHFKSYVVVVLDWSDTYEVHFITTHGTLKKSMNMVYFDELFERIDKFIEFIPEYSH